jgi:hypothetical protein
MFSRNHNTIAENLLSVNEEGWYQDSDSITDPEKKKKYVYLVMSLIHKLIPTL